MGNGALKPRTTRVLEEAVGAAFERLMLHPENKNKLAALQVSVAKLNNEIYHKLRVQWNPYAPGIEDYHKAADLVYNLVYKEFEKVLKREHRSSVLHDIATMNASTQPHVDGLGDANGRAIIERALEQIRDGTSGR